VRKVLSQFPNVWKNPVISVSKGIENNTGMRMSQIILETLDISQEKVVILSGPSHAEEVSRQYPTAIVAACADIN
jgi:glycerol-3-phosphate dehydrogenase (NAD(P)+)